MSSSSLRWAATAAPPPQGQLDVLAGYGITAESMGCEIRSSHGDGRARRSRARRAGLHRPTRLRGSRLHHPDQPREAAHRLQWRDREWSHEDDRHRPRQAEGRRHAPPPRLRHVPPTDPRRRRRSRSRALPSRSGWRSSRTTTPACCTSRPCRPTRMLDRERELLAMARAAMARLPIATIDVLVLDEHRQGHQRTRDGLATSSAATTRGRPGPAQPIERIVVRDLTDETEGNAVGIGMADVVLRRRGRADRPPQDVHELHHRQDAGGRASP